MKKQRTNLAIFFVIIAFVFDYSIAYSDSCKPNRINFDVCKEAKKIQKEIAQNLPQNLSRNLSLVSVLSNGPEISMTAQLTYTKAFLENNVNAAGQTMSQIDAKMQSFTRNYLCSNKVTKSFIGLGGRLIMNYRYSNGENAFNIAVKHC